jgi:phage recombination protein Bet
MSTAMTLPQASQWESREMIETIKQTVCKGATDAQLKMFIEVCKATGLNPFLKEIWFVPAVGVMAGRDGYLRVANEHPQFDGMSTTVERDEKGIPLKATCSVWRKDRGHPITCEAWYSEYRKNSNVWQTYPSAMISKIAEVLALKRSFAINGIVTEEEIGEQKLAAQDAQQDVAQRKIQQLRAAPAKGSLEATQEAVGPRPKLPPCNNPECPVGCPDSHAMPFGETSPATIIELADSLDAPPEPVVGTEPEWRKQAALGYEQRESAKQQEAVQALKGDGKPKETRKRGAISFAALKSWGEIKKEILALTGTTDLYYEALKAGGYHHADEIKTLDDAAKIWKALKAITAELSPKKQDSALLLELETQTQRIGQNAMDYALQAHGLKSIRDVLALDGEPFQAFMQEVREIVV